MQIINTALVSVGGDSTNLSSEKPVASVFCEQGKGVCLLSSTVSCLVLPQEQKPTLEDPCGQEKGKRNWPVWPREHWALTPLRGPVITSLTHSMGRPLHTS